MLISSSASRRLLVFTSCCALVVICSLMLTARSATTSLCSTTEKKCTSALALPDDSAEIAAAKANMEHEASIRHQKIQNSLDEAEAEGNAVAARIRSESAAFLAHMRKQGESLVSGPSPHSSVARFSPYFFVTFVCCAYFTLVLR